MSWISTDPPAELVWITVLLAFVGFAIAVPGFLQMVWGRPYIYIDFGDERIGAGRVFTCAIWNWPVTSRLLMLLGINRVTVEDAIVSFTVKEDGTGRTLVASVVPHIKMAAGNLSQRARIPASKFEASFPVATRQPDGVVQVAADNYGPALEPGGYIFEVNLAVSGKVVHSKRRLFVTPNDDGCFWEPPPLGKLRLSRR